MPVAGGGGGGEHNGLDQMLVLQLRVRQKKELTKATSKGSVVVEHEHGCHLHVIVANLGDERERAATMGQGRNVFGRGMKKGGHPYSSGPIGRADGFNSVNRRTGMTVPRRNTMHRQNIHTV